MQSDASFFFFLFFSGFGFGFGFGGYYVFLCDELMFLELRREAVRGGAKGRQWGSFFSPPSSLA